MPQLDPGPSARPLPATVDSLCNDLAALGVASGMTLIVHASLSRLGWVCGGPVAVILALEEVLGPRGTLVMPTFSADLSDPAGWQNPPVPEPWWPIIRATMPAFEPDLTPSWEMGVIAETFRKQAGTFRSSHPHSSFAARGAYAEHIIAGHRLSFGLGNGSPLARIYDLEGYVLLLGVGHGNNSSLHLAEARAAYPGKRTIRAWAPLLINGVRSWESFDDLDWDDDDFVTIGAEFAQDTGLEQRGYISTGKAILVPQQPLIDYAVAWMEKHRV